MNSPFEYEIELKYLSKEQLIRLVEDLQQKIVQTLKLCNRYIANEKSNSYPDYYYLSMFEEIKKELSKGSEE